jgi:hypothetical protein
VVKDGYAIILDAWAGKCGNRKTWVRIMRVDHINIVFNEIMTTKSLDITDNLLRAYFCVPHAANTEKCISENHQPELLSIGVDNLMNDKWSAIFTSKGY